jgi:hypothetical protein
MDSDHFFEFKWDGNGTLQIAETLAEESLRGLIEITQEKGALNTNLIPDTIIKTTPQSLSDADKNQALSNLGIDPVIWKYLCNPHIVEFDRTNTEFNNAIPKELSDIIYQNHKFNHLILSTVLIKIYKELEEGGDVVWKVERITSYDEWGNVTFDGEEFGYDINTRLFLV